jgi:hypothetical protein
MVSSDAKCYIRALSGEGTMRRSIAVFASLWVSGAAGQSLSALDLRTPHLLTSETTVLCEVPSDIKEGERAIGDQKWLAQLGCAYVGAGVAVERLDPTFIGDRRGPWKVRIKLPGGEAKTLWGEPWAFTFLDGRRVPVGF